MESVKFFKKAVQNWKVSSSSIIIKIPKKIRMGNVRSRLKEQFLIDEIFGELLKILDGRLRSLDVELKMQQQRLEEVRELLDKNKCQCINERNLD